MSMGGESSARQRVGRPAGVGILGPIPSRPGGLNDKLQDGAPDPPIRRRGAGFAARAGVEAEHARRAPRDRLRHRRLCPRRPRSARRGGPPPPRRRAAGRDRRPRARPAAGAARDARTPHARALKPSTRVARPGGGERSGRSRPRGGMTDDAATILVVEDDDATRAFLADNLTADGYDLLVADSARDGARLLETKFPDLLVLDVGLPDASGLDLLRRIRSADGITSRIDPHTAVLVLSGRAGEVDRVRGFDRSRSIGRTDVGGRAWPPNDRTKPAHAERTLGPRAGCRP